MEKPSAKLYPDYYEVIENPIDMLSIQANIKAEKYQSEEEILADFKVTTTCLFFKFSLNNLVLPLKLFPSLFKFFCAVNVQELSKVQ